MSSERQQRRLGRGLEALINSAPTIAPPGHAEGARGGGTATPYRELPLTDIRPNRYQPRREFKADELAELQASIKSTGLLQPITVRPAGGDRFELIAGERRLRAASALGWTKIVVVDTSPLGIGEKRRLSEELHETIRGGRRVMRGEIVE